MEEDTLSISGAVATAGRGPVAGDEPILCVCEGGGRWTYFRYVQYDCGLMTVH